MKGRRFLFSDTYEIRLLPYLILQIMMNCLSNTSFRQLAVMFNSLIQCRSDPIQRFRIQYSASYLGLILVSKKLLTP